MFKCPHCGAIFNEPITKNAIIDEDTGDEITVSKEMMIRICPNCKEQFSYKEFCMVEEEKE